MPQSLRQNFEQKLKENDEIILQQEGNNSADMLFFTNYFKMHRLKISSIKEMKASSFGEFLPAIFKFEEGELILKSIYVEKYFGSVLFFYENGKAVKVDINSYKTNRKKLLNAYYSGSKLINIFFETNSSYYMLKTFDEKAAIVNSSLLETKNKRNAQGQIIVKLKKTYSIKEVLKLNENEVAELKSLIYNKIPATPVSIATQLKLN